MANFFTSSIGKKILMSITGLFLIVFLIVHLSLNSLIVFDASGVLFNKAAHFMTTNPVIKVMEPILALGVFAHIAIATMITIMNQKKRDVNYPLQKRYAVRKSSFGSSWTSRNMYVLGAVVFVFLVIHLINFYWKIKVTGDPLLAHVMIDGEEIENAFALVTNLFVTWKWSVALYVIGAIALGLHLFHGVWSAFQTIGLSNKKWRVILNWVGIVFSIILAGGFAFIPLYVMINSMV